MISLLGPDNCFEISSFLGDSISESVDLDVATIRSLIFYNRLVAIGDIGDDGVLNKLIVIAAPDVGSPCISLTLLYYSGDEVFLRQALDLCDKCYSNYFSKVKLRSETPEIPQSLIESGFEQEIRGPKGLNIFSYFLPSFKNVNLQ